MSLEEYNPDIETFYSGDIFTAYQHIMRESSLDLILLEINENYPKNSYDLIEKINKLRLYIPIIIITTNDSTEAATLAIENKLSGFISRNYSNKMILDSVICVLEENMFAHHPIPVSLNGSRKDSKDESVLLQEQVMDLLIKGFMNNQIADMLNTPPNIIRKNVHEALSSISEDS